MSFNKYDTSMESDAERSADYGASLTPTRKESRVFVQQRRQRRLKRWERKRRQRAAMWTQIEPAD